MLRCTSACHVRQDPEGHRRAARATRRERDLLRLGASDRLVPRRPHRISGGDAKFVQGTVNIRPASSVSLSFGPSLSVNRSTGQFVRSVGDPLATLRGNAVLRWEYRPGSALFMVWQQERSGFEPIGDFDFRRDVGDIFRTVPTNVFLIKATYWIGR